MADSNEVTLIIHGTFAVGEDKDLWWRRGSDTGDSDGTFADRLEQELAARDKPGTVWCGLDNASQYEQFEWSGKNKHRDRVKAGRKLAASMATMAESRQDNSQPLAVNLVAHSHGGNVALESLRHLTDDVHIKTVTMLGTPMIHRRPGARLLALYMAFFTTLLFWFLLLDLVNPQFVDEFGTPDSIGVRLALAALLLSVYPWFAYWTMAAVEPIYRVLVGVFRKPHWHGWKGERVYGPSVKQIEAKEIGPIWLLASHGDEADLILNVGASPRFAYKDLVQEKWTKWWQRPIELLYLRPWFRSIALPVLQATLEHFALGFGWFRVMVNDYEVLRNDPCIKRVNVTNSARQTLNRELQRRLGAESTTSATDPDGHDDEEHKYGAELVAMAKTIGGQIRLRHSMYYESDEITGLVADAITGLSLTIDLREEATSVEQIETATAS